MKICYVVLKKKRFDSFSDVAQPVCLPERGEQWNQENMVITGWGAIKCEETNLDFNFCCIAMVS